VHVYLFRLIGPSLSFSLQPVCSYLQYLKADYPRLMIRFEDVLYRQEDVIRKIRECIGADTNKSFVFRTSSPKWHGDPTDFVRALEKYATESLRCRGLNNDDRRYASEHLDPQLMRIFHYRPIPLEAAPGDLEGPFEGWENPAPDNSIPRETGEHPLDLMEKKAEEEKKRKQLFAAGKGEGAGAR